MLIDWLFNASSVLLGLLLLLGFVWLSGMVRYIPNSAVGVVEKLWSPKGSVRRGLIALMHEAGYQPDILRGGFHFFPPFQYRIHRLPLVTIAQGKIGYVFARDGQSLESGQTLASNKQAKDFEDVRGFLEAGGQKGPQRKVMREGTYALNLVQFAVLTADGVLAHNMDQTEAVLFEQMRSVLHERQGFEPVVLTDNQDQIGIITVHDGPALPAGEIIAPTVGTDALAADFHNNFQDIEAFLAGGGRRGRQLQVLVDGSYFINRLFVTVERVAKTIVPVGYVGVVVSYTGSMGSDVSGEGYRHGELVERGYRGVWRDPLLPGKYAFNTFAGQVIQVPTTNFILKWSKEVTGEHKFDENLAEVSLITKDAFEPALPLSVVVHIDYKKAPLVVQRFGDIKRLVEQTLDPMVSAYFKNIGQTKTLIQLLQERAEIQQISSVQMKDKFLSYSLELQEVLIGTPHSSGSGAQIEDILRQLRERQVAVEQVATYKLKEDAATQERALREAEARAAMQSEITRSELAILTHANEGKAAVARAQQDAQKVEIDARAAAARVRVGAEAEADRLRLEGEGEARQVEAVGRAQAEATRAQVDAFGGAQNQLAARVFDRFAQAIEAGKIPIVPQIQLGNTAGGSASVVDAVLALVLNQQTGLGLQAKGEQANKALDAGG